MISGSNCRHLKRPETEGVSRSIELAYQITPPKLQHFPKDYWAALHPYSLGGAYVNFMMEEEIDRVRATYRNNYDRLVEIKRNYDPNNFFHVNRTSDCNRQLFPCADAKLS